MVCLQILLFFTKVAMTELKSCRVCTKLIKDEKLVNLFEEIHNWIAKIEEITGILLKNTKPLPQYICKLCQEDLEGAYDFRERCINAQNYFNSVDFDSKILTNDLEIKDEKPQSFDEFNNAEGFCTAELEIKDELPIEEKNIAEFCYVKTETLDIFQAGNESHDIDSSSNSNYNSSSNSADLLSLSATKKDQETGPKVKKQVRKRMKPRNEKPKKRKGKLTTDKLCDQCGIYFDCKSKFLIHQRRHTGEKIYHCEICPEQFFLQSELKRHVRKHTGERPYPCRYCERRFVECSSRIMHERASPIHNDT